MRNNSYALHYAISRYSIREFKTGAEPFMVVMMIIIIIIIMCYTKLVLASYDLLLDLDLMFICLVHIFQVDQSFLSFLRSFHFC